MEPDGGPGRGAGPAGGASDPMPGSPEEPLRKPPDVDGEADDPLPPWDGSGPVGPDEPAAPDEGAEPEEPCSQEWSASRSSSSASFGMRVVSSGSLTRPG